MTIAEVLRQVSGRTTDVFGYVASYSAHAGGEVVAYLESRLDTSSSSMANWRMHWTAHWRDDSNLTSATSTNLNQLLSRFKDVDLQPISRTSPKEFFSGQDG